MELLNMLTSQLNVSEQQASGGAGLLFKLAQEKLGAGEFSQITEAIPGIDRLISSAPDSGGLSSVLGGLASSFGGSGGQLGNLVSLAGGFSKLNLDADMIAKFVPIVLSFVKSQGGDALEGMLANVLG
ncbi:conserved hypothetical protein [Chlorobaculum parvum NCIB 8327]|uniref:DUF2780 domain-containing protein n=1 Tax=Chlorobaculum parvum (strain DSM 263 / NCIMB 8327) TaxID=517417 RepID=B3QM15_CHLP8|nr:DUF2780 domain-containing protein [Chlorobaculum parvum]ACF10968.1 conserved hypothetical protein [Chlorobaculum parvum NCIB 8327]